MASSRIRAKDVDENLVPCPVPAMKALLSRAITLYGWRCGSYIAKDLGRKNSHACLSAVVGWPHASQRSFTLSLVRVNCLQTPQRGAFVGLLVIIFPPTRTITNCNRTPGLGSWFEPDLQPIIQQSHGWSQWKSIPLFSIGGYRELSKLN